MEAKHLLMQPLREKEMGEQLTLREKLIVWIPKSSYVGQAAQPKEKEEPVTPPSHNFTFSQSRDLMIV